MNQNPNIATEESEDRYPVRLFLRLFCYDSKENKYQDHFIAYRRIKECRICKEEETAFFKFIDNSHTFVKGVVNIGYVQDMLREAAEVSQAEIDKTFMNRRQRRELAAATEA